MDYHPKVLWCHVANERKTETRNLGGFWVGQGVKKGVPDNLFFEPHPYYNGMAIEVKTKTNRPTYNQLKWMYELKKRNWYVCVCYNFPSFAEVLQYYLKGLTPTNLVSKSSSDQMIFNMDIEREKWEQRKFTKKLAKS